MSENETEAPGGVEEIKVEESDSRLGSLAAVQRSHDTYVNAEVPDPEVQRMNASEHAGGENRDDEDRRADSGPINPDTVPSTVPEDAIGQASFRKVDEADVVEVQEDGGQPEAVGKESDVDPSRQSGDSD